MSISVVLKRLKKNCQLKKSFIVRWQVNKMSDKDCEHVLKVLDRFKLKTMKDYHDLYLKCDITLLANVFEKFRNNSLRN